MSGPSTNDSRSGTNTQSSNYKDRVMLPVLYKYKNKREDINNRQAYLDEEENLYL